MYESLITPPPATPTTTGGAAPASDRAGMAPVSYKDPSWDLAEQEAASKTGVPSDVMRVIRTVGERSNGNQVSPKNAQGVYQFIPSTRDLFLKKYGVDAYSNDPKEQALAAAYHLKESYERTGSWDKAMAGYNGGMSAERGTNGTKENRDYAARTSAALGGKVAAPTSLTAASDTPYFTPKSGGYASLITPPPLARTTLEAAGDVALGAGAGVVQGVEMVASAFGADNAVARGANDVAQKMVDMQSPARKQQREQRAAAIQEAETSGSTWSEIVANVGAFTDAPVESTLNAIGTSVPTLLTALIPGLGQANVARLVVQGAVGAAQGAGAVKGSIYEAVERELSKPGPNALSPDDAKKAAAAAQAYDSQNGGDIALGALLGWTAGSTGIEKSLARILSKEGGEAAASGVAKRAAIGVLAEAPMEGAQGGQERLAANRALQNEGVDVPTWQGVAGSAAGEAVASVVPGGVFGALTPSKPAAPPELPPELAPVAEKAAEPNSPLSKAAMAANTPEIIAQREAQRQAAEPAAAPSNASTAARLAELESIGEDRPAQTIKDDQGRDVEIPAEPGRFFTQEEKDEYDDLKARRDSTPGAKPKEADTIGDRAKEIAAAVRDSGALDTLRSPDSPVKATDLVKDLATAQSPNTPAAAREQAIGRVEFALQWAGIDIAPAPKAKDEPKSDQQADGMPEQKPAQIDPVIAAMSNPKVAPDDKAALRDSYNAAFNIRLPQATRDQALAQAREIAGRYAAADVPKAAAGADTSGERAQTPAVLGPIDGAPATLLAQAERLEDGAFQLAAEDFPDEAQELRDQAASLRKQAEGARSSEPAQGQGPAGFDGITPAPAKRATAAQTAAPAGANEITIRSNNIASSIGGSGALDALRGAESPVSAKDLIENLATAQNPAAPVASREEALGRVEFALEWAGIDIKPADPQAAAAQSQEEQSADQQPAPQGPTAAAGGKQADIVSQAERMEAGAAQFDAEGFTIEAQQLRDQADSLREQAATVRAGETGFDLEAKAVGDASTATNEQNVAGATGGSVESQTTAEPVQLPAARTTPAGDGPAYLRRRKASLRQLIDNGLNRIERRENGFFLSSANGRQEFKLDGMADSQLARAALAESIRDGAEKANVNLSAAQALAGNGKKGRVEFDGLKIGIENYIGSERVDKANSPPKWRTKMALAHYGDVTGTVGADGDGVDVYVVDSPRPGSLAFVIDQYNEDGSFDETKTVLGASSEAEALRVYDAGFSDGSGPDRRGAVTAMPIAEFRAWAFSPAAKKPAGATPEAAPGAVVDGSMKVKLSKDESVDVDLVKELPEVESVARGGRATRISKKQGAVIEAIARAFGKDVQFYTGANSTRVGDGFILPGDQSKIYLNATSSMSPVVVFGHELMHQLKRDNPEAHAAIEAVVARRMNREAVATTYGKLGYSESQVMEELVSDLGGDLMADKSFWADVMAEVREANGDSAAKKILAQLAEFLYRAIDAMTKNLRSYADTGAGSKLVDDMTEIRAAFQAALAGYMQTHGIAKPAMQAEILRAGQDAKRSAVRNQTTEDQRKALTEKLRGTDGWLKAPNGKMTNLDERQWVVVRTPAFKAWFGDWENDPINASKAVDENGEPKVFYHGSTEAGFTEFDTDGNGKTEGTGAFFTDDFRMAVGYSGTRDDAPVYAPEKVFADPDLIDGLSIEAGILAEVVTSSRGDKSWEWYESEEAALEDLELEPGEELVQKPGYRMTDPDGYETVGTKDEIIDAISDIKVRAPGVYDAFLNVRDLVEIDWHGKNWDDGPEEQIWSILDEDGYAYDTAYSQEDADAILAKNPGFSVEQTSQAQYDSTDDAARGGRDMGADGVLIKDVFDTGPKGYAEDGNVLVVYDPKNIKSASENSGAFDPADANITRSADRSDALTVEGYHFSQQPRKMLSSVMYGTGLQGSDREAILRQPDERLRQRISFYVNKGTGVRPEAGVGGYAHRATLENVYDSNADVKRLKQGRDKRAFESAVLDAGYDGYLDRLEGTQPGQVIMLGRRTIQPELLGPMSKIDNAKPVPKPAARDMDLGDRISANQSLPAGQLTPQRWAEVLGKAMPAEAAELEAAGLFDGDTAMYKDQLVARVREALGEPMAVLSKPRENRHGFVPELLDSAKGRLALPEKALFVQATNNGNAARQIDNIDKVLRKFPSPESSANDWNRMMAYALADRDVPVPPYRMIEMIRSDGYGKLLAGLSAGQVADADHGFENAAQFRKMYEDGQADVITTGKLALWSFLSRGVSPYVQESLFMDAVEQIDPWIDLAAKGRFDEAALERYHAWSNGVAPAGSGQPGSGSKHNLNAFGGSFLLNMSKPGKGGKPHLQHLHELISDFSVTGPEIRREFAKFGEGVGIDNKVVSFTLLVSGRDDVMVLDRVQIKGLWDDGRFGNRNLYDGQTNAERKIISGSKLADLFSGARGLLVYEAIERAIGARVGDYFAAASRPEAASLGRFHWETWVAYSGQEASHGTIAGLMADTAGKPTPYAGITAKEGEYGNYAYGARYGLDSVGLPYFLYDNSRGESYRFSVTAFREMLELAKKPSSKIVPTKFLVSKDQNDKNRQAPWYTDPRVDRGQLDRLIAQFGAKEARAGAVSPDGAQPTADGAGPVARSADRGGDRGRQPLGVHDALPGAPRVAGATGPDPRLVAVAEAYTKKVGIDLRRQVEYVAVDEGRAARIAAAYEAMEHAPQDRKVKAAYADLIKQTRAQYDALVEAGYSFYFADQANDPYAGNPWNAMRDLRANQRMAVFPTAAGYGTDGVTMGASDDNPMLVDTGMTWGYGSADGQPMRVLANDLFRAVHDAFGHGLEGAGFRAQGEENAWQGHIRMFTGAAKGAITSETRGQNSWLNYNATFGEANRTAKVEDTVFADQKTGLMPEWTWTEGVAADMPAQRSASRDLPKATLADFDPRGISRLLSLDNWAIMTAENPMGEAAGEKTNAAAMRRLRQRLAEMDGVEFRAIRGKYGDNEENSLAVVGITEEQAVELGREFNQDSVLTRKGFIYQDGSINPATGIEVFRNPPENYYSRIGDTIFRIDIDFDKKIDPAADAKQQQRIDALKELIACLGK